MRANEKGARPMQRRRESRIIIFKIRGFSIFRLEIHSYTIDHDTRANLQASAAEAASTVSSKPQPTQENL